MRQIKSKGTISVTDITVDMSSKKIKIFLNFNEDGGCGNTRLSQVVQQCARYCTYQW